jgi:hypothetical protein
MFNFSRLTLLALVAWLLAVGEAVFAQHAPQATVTVPFHQTGSSYYEQFGVNFGFHVGNFFFEQNGGAAPPFGGFTPGAGLHTGFNVHAPGGFDGHFLLTAGQGAQTSSVAQSVTTTMPSAVPASISDTSQIPFVIGAVPVVGDGGGISPVRERLDRLKAGGAAAYGPRGGQAGGGNNAPRGSSAEKAPAADAGQPAPAAGSAAADEAPLGSVAQMRQLRAAADAATQREVQALIAKAKEAEGAGKLGVARIFYQQAANRAASPLREQLLARAAQMNGRAKATAKRAPQPATEPR